MGGTTQRGLGEAWAVVIAAAVLLAVVQGFRASLGLFVSPINTATGIGLSGISFALAASQLASGFAQPFVGRLSERHGHARVVAAGAIATAAGIATLPWLTTGSLLTAGLVAVAVAGTALASAPVLVAAVMARVPPDSRGRASGIVGAGGSAGQLVIGPSAQAGIAAAGWVATMLALAGLTLACAALARCFRAPSGRPAALVPGPASEADDDRRSAAMARAAALRDRTFWCIAASFFVCGFHVSFLLAHMPGFIATCGLRASLSGTWLAIIGVCNVAGSLVAGHLVDRVSPRRMLIALYAARAAIVLAFAALPVSATSVVAFSVAIGLTYMATLPPTTALVERTYGTGNVASLFGVVMVLHQAGSFLGVWLGGVILDVAGGFEPMWLVDAALAIAAALACTAIRESAAQAPRPAALRTPAPRPLAADAR